MGGPGSYTLTATQPNLTLTQESPSTIGNAGQATLTVDGLDLEANTTYSLVGPGGQIAAAAARYVNASLAYVTFNLTGVAAGAYELEAADTDGDSTTLEAPVQVTEGGGPDIVTSLVGESAVRVGRTSVFYIEYSNVGNDDAPAPLLTVTSPTETPMSLDPSVAPYTIGFSILGINQDGPAGVLPPGSHFEVPVDFSPPVAGPFEFDWGTTTASDTSEPLSQSDWEEIVSEISPDVTGAADWPAVEAQLQLAIGTTWGQYVGLLDQYATLLHSNAGDPSNPADVLQLVVNQAVAAVSTSISGSAVATAPGVMLAGNTITATNSTTGDVYTANILNNGSFVFPTVTAGSYTFNVADALVDSSTQPVTINSGQAVTGVKVTLDPEVTLTGHVTAAATGAPVAGATVVLIAGDNDVATATTDAAGDYSVAFAPGAYTLMICGAAGLARAYSDVTLPAGPARLDFALASESAATGTVSFSDGQPVQSLGVVAVLHGEEPFPYFSGTFTGPSFQLNRSTQQGK